eukprot:TRINITY_DN547_c0_g1_i1.p1 TRINITY_DN547_c0_g1~~TRINITY_DN547_c0_g1_i1.p1  ORF type:complete len:513 (-),score=77.72 TRINITY_DN547_c0_g1_i1:54-1592(-)
MAFGSGDDADISAFTLFFTWIAYGVMITFGYISEFMSFLGIFLPFLRRNEEFDEAVLQKKGYAPLLRRKEYFYTRRLFSRVRDCWDRPINSAPGAFIDVMMRKGMGKSSVMFEDLTTTGVTAKNCLNLGSYNYLGFAENSGPAIEEVKDSITKFGIGTCSSRMESGTHDIHRELEQRFSKFIGKEDCLIFGMGYATNSTTIPALVGKGCLIISDSLNHASIVVGCRASGASIRVFEHNNVENLEKVIEKALLEGQPKTHRDWKKILIVIEGIYSMEGEICLLPQIVAVKKKYKCYLWVDEAHSIGALGKGARGVCDYWGVDPKDVDILMGTFTKSFGSVGGYVCADSNIINYLRQTSFASVYAASMPFGCVQMVISTLKIITGEDGTDDGQRRITSLRENANMFKTKLIDQGFRVVGDLDSPVVPVMLHHPAKVAELSRFCLKRKLAVVVVGFPATSFLGSRARFCLSAGHTKERLLEALEHISEIGDLLGIKYDLGTERSKHKDLGEYNKK